MSKQPDERATVTPKPLLTSGLKDGAPLREPTDCAAERGRTPAQDAVLDRERALGSLWPGVLFRQRLDYSFEYASDQIQELTGVAPAEWASHSGRFWEVVHEVDASDVRRHCERAAHESGVTSMTYRVRHWTTGRIFHVQERRQRVLGSDGGVVGFEGVWLDITRQTLAERRLAVAAWKETLALITMGLAHDLGNVIAGVHSLSESFLAQTDETHPFFEGLGLIRKNSLHAGEVLHRIVNLHQSGREERRHLDLNEAVGDVLDLVRKVIPRRIALETALAATPLPVCVDPSELRQVLLNLTVNAADAMPQTGKLTLTTGLVECMPAVKHFCGTLPASPAVCVSVEDTGCGIPARHLEAIFDPFFTTKSTDKGSGLGLYNARLFVRKHGGAISVGSIEGRGARFTVWLPQANFTETVAGPEPPPVRRRSLLLVGGPDEMREATAEWLRVHGYHVVMTAMSENQTEFVRSGDYQFSGVFALVEPGDRQIAGQLADWRRHQPRLKIILKPLVSTREGLDRAALEQGDLIVTMDCLDADVLERMRRLFAPEE